MTNVVFISVDDLNDWTNALGGYAGTVYTPNLDRLMESGTTFTNAFSQVALCNPSRVSVLTGQSPQNTGVFSNRKYVWEGDVAPENTLFGVFREAGYTSVGVGKLFYEDPTAAAEAVMFDAYVSLGDRTTDTVKDEFHVGPQSSETDLADEVHTDYIVEFLDDYVPTPAEPLLLSVGLLKPHPDWVVPQEYFDLYPIEDIVIDVVPGDADDIPSFALENAGWDAYFLDEDAIDSETHKELIQGYLASISFMDAQLGEILDAIENSAIADDTVIVLWSDHGYQLGDKDMWHKFTLWDSATRVPLMFAGPGIPEGETVDDVVELLDIFPTMLELTGIKDNGLDLDGDSLMPYFEGGSPVEPAMAFTWMYGSVSIRTNEYRYTLYEDGSKELYDVVNDPELVDNLAGEEGFADEEGALDAALRAEFGLTGYDQSLGLIGDDGANILTSVLEAGFAVGGAGDDVYFIAPSMTVVESADGGNDQIITSADRYTLPDFVEELQVKGTSTVLRGNELDNTISGDAYSIFSGEGDDLVISGPSASSINLGDGNDDAFGNDGDDAIYGGGGDDTLFGDAGNDYLEGGNGRDQLHGGDGFDMLFGGGEADAVFGDLGNDFLRGGDGYDELYGGGADDTVYGGSLNDSLFGEEGDDLLFGQRGYDDIRGGDGKDLLDGGGGNDTLDGGDGSDILRGSGGGDSLEGGLGADTFVFFGDFGHDTITDFNVSGDQDLIDISGVWTVLGVQDLFNNHLNQAGANVIFDDHLGHSVTLQNVDMDELSEFDFVL